MKEIIINQTDLSEKEVERFAKSHGIETVFTVSTIDGKTKILGM